MILLRGGLVVTLDAKRRVGIGDVLVDGARISAVSLAGDPPLSAPRSMDVSGCIVLPGFSAKYPEPLLVQDIVSDSQDGGHPQNG